jgi:dGTPase
MLPAIVADRCGRDRSTQLGTFVRSMVAATVATGRIGMLADMAEALAAFRRFNYEHVYLRPASRRQADAVVSLLHGLVEHYAKHPQLVPRQTACAAVGADVDPGDLAADGHEARRSAVAYVAGMTDRFACEQGISRLGLDPSVLPRGIGV